MATVVRQRSTHRSAVYSRYSTDQQEVKSEQRQISDCKAYITRHKYTLVRVFSDRGRSGTSMMNRTELLALLTLVRRREVDKIIIEDLDRLSRNLSDVLAIFDELQAFGVELHDIHNGRLDRVHVVIRGYISEEGRIRFLALSKAGKENAVRNGRLMSVLAFGYRRDPEDSAIHVRDPKNAGLVANIFEWSVDGLSCNAIARRLTAMKVPPPRQNVPGGSGEGSDVPLKLKRWNSTTIIKIIRNPLYLGFVSWGKSTPVYDSRTRQRTGTEVTDQATWIVVEIPELRIIDDAVWERANKSISRLAYPGERNVGRFLLTGKVVCGTCGSDFKVQCGEHNSRYRCIGHMDGDGTCDHHTNHRIDWIEAAVIEVVMTEALDPAALDRYEATFRSEVSRLLQGDEKRRTEITRRLDKIHELLERSFSADRVVGFSEARLGTFRMGLEGESDALEAELQGLRRPADMMKGIEALHGLQGRLGDMLDDVPFRPTEPAGIALATLFRSVVQSVRIMPPDRDRRVRLEILIDPLQGSREGDHGEGLGGIALNATVDVAALVVLERRNRVAGRRKASELVGGSAPQGVSDAEWASVEHVMKPVPGRDGSTVDPRLVLNGMLFCARHGCRPLKVPQRFGSGRVFDMAVRRTIYAGVWDGAVAILRSIDARCLDGARIERFDCATYQRRAVVGLRLTASRCLEDSEKLLAMARSGAYGAVAQRRFRFVAALLKGATQSAAGTAAAGVGYLPIHAWRQYKRGGIDALVALEHRRPRCRLNVEQLARLRKAAEAGIDPANPMKPMTYAVLVRLCEDWFGITYTIRSMASLCAQKGFQLRELVLSARHDRLRKTAAEKVTQAASTVPVARRLSPPASRDGRRRRRAEAGAAGSDPHALPNRKATPSREIG